MKILVGLLNGSISSSIIGELALGVPNSVLAKAFPNFRFLFNNFDPDLSLVNFYSPKSVPD
jgi:hypothetical protein